MIAQDPGRHTSDHQSTVTRPLPVVPGGQVMQEDVTAVPAAAPADFGDAGVSNVQTPGPAQASDPGTGRAAKGTKPAKEFRDTNHPRPERQQPDTSLQEPADAPAPAPSGTPAGPGINDVDRRAVPPRPPAAGKGATASPATPKSGKAVRFDPQEPITDTNRPAQRVPQ